MGTSLTEGSCRVSSPSFDMLLLLACSYWRELRSMAWLGLLMERSWVDECE